MKTTLTFLGAAGTVTGSRHLLETRGKRILVDCGLFQGPKENRLKNWDPLPIEAKSIDTVLLTHAHIDHIGYLPKLVKQGFRGKIIGTRATIDLAKILLLDTAHLQAEEAKWANKKGYSKHKPALPLYTKTDAEQAIKRLESVSYGEEFHPLNGVRAKYRDMGHILGSAYLDLKTTDRDGTQRKLVFTGDIGRPNDIILRPPSQAYNVDYLVIESTYGDRRHEQENVRSQLAKTINRVLEKNGVLLIPSFAVGRSQSLLYLLREMETAGEIPKVPIFLDSPMAKQALGTHQNHIRDLNLTCRSKHLEGIDIFRPANLHITADRKDSMAIAKLSSRAIIIAGSGMATGGRILHHMHQRLPHRNCTVLFIGYQAEGTRGRTLLEGKKSIRMFGQELEVNAEITSIDGFSGHADYMEMLAWLMAFNKPVKHTFLVHGEPVASESFAEKIKEQFAWHVTLPQQGQSFEIDF